MSCAQASTAHHQRIEPREPGELHSFGRVISNTKAVTPRPASLANTSTRDRREPMAAVQRPEREDLDRQQDDDGTRKTTSVAAGGRRLDRRPPSSP